eukprot:3918113-Pyramimonas_sp.AAC.1
MRLRDPTHGDKLIELGTRAIDQCIAVFSRPLEAVAFLRILCRKMRVEQRMLAQRAERGTVRQKAAPRTRHGNNARIHLGWHLSAISCQGWDDVVCASMFDVAEFHLCCSHVPQRAEHFRWQHR